MPGIMVQPQQQQQQQPMQFNSNIPGSGAQTAGYNYAMKQLGNSLNASSSTMQGQQMQLGQQLHQNQGQVAQSLTNRGLGNTTVANTMQQAPLQTYNQGMANVQDAGAMRQMQGYQNLANAAMQGGQQITQTAQPYTQSVFQNQMAQQNQQQQMAQQQQQMMQQNDPWAMNPTQAGFGLKAGQVNPMYLAAFSNLR